MEPAAATAAIESAPRDEAERLRIRVLLLFGAVVAAALLLIRAMWPVAGLETASLVLPGSLLLLCGLAIPLLPQKIERARLCVAAVTLASIGLTSYAYYLSLEAGVPPRPNVSVTGAILLSVALAVELDLRQQIVLSLLGILIALVAIVLAPHPDPHSQTYALVLTSSVVLASVVARRTLQTRSERERAVERSWLLLRREFETHLEQTPDLVHRIDADGRLLYVNAAWARTLGFDADAVRGRSILDFVDPAEVGHCRELLGTLRCGEAIAQASCRLRRSDGQSVWLRGSIAPPLEPGRDNGAALGIFRDVSNEVALEQRLRDSQRLLEAAIEALPSRVALLDESGTVLLTNRAWPGGSDCAGCPAPLQEVKVGSELAAAVRQSRTLSAADRAGILDRLAAAQGGTTPGSSSAVYACHCDHATAWFQMHLAGFSCSERRYLVVALEDVTPIKLAERAANTARERFDRAVSAAQAVIWEYFPARDEVFFAPQVTDLTGFTAAELGCGLEGWMQHVHPGDRALLRGAIAERLDAYGAAHFEHRFVRKDGKVIWLDVRGAATGDKDGLPEVFSGSMIDVTAHHEATAALAARERQLQEMVDSALHAIVTIDPEGIVTEYNPAAERLCGYPRAEVVGRPFDTNLEDDDARDRARRFVTSMLSGTRQACYAGEATIRNRSGEPVEVEVVCFPGPGSDPTRAYLHVFLRDVSEQRRLTRMKDEMVATLSHELRTPLTSLHGFAELLANREFPRDVQLRYLEIIQRETQRLTRLVNGLLELRRAESGREPVDIAAVDTVAIAHEAVERVPAEWRQKRSIVIDAAPQLPPAAADADALGRVFDNLLSNACKYSGDGARITVAIRSSGDRIACSVADEGIGIDSADMKRIFDVFYRGAAARSLSVSGTGLGLPICKRIVEMLGGRIGVTSAPGVGTTMTVELPRFAPRDETRYTQKANERESAAARHATP